MQSDPSSNSSTDGGMFKIQLQKFIEMNPADISIQPSNQNISVAQVQQAVRWLLNRLNQLEPSHIIQ